MEAVNVNVFDCWANNLLLALGFKLNDVALIASPIDSAPEKKKSLSERYGDQILIDASLVGDMFFPLFNKDVSLSQADAEDRFELEDDELEEEREKYLRWRGFIRSGRATDEDHYRFEKWTERMIKKSENLKYDKRHLDFLLGEGPEVPDPIDEHSTGQAWYTYLEMYIDRLNPSEWALALDVLEGAFAEKKVSWYYFVKCGLALSYRLVRYAPRGEWDSTFHMLKKHNATYHQKTVSLDDRFYGEMSFDMESAIDQMAEAKDLAERNHISVEEAYYNLLEYQEAVGMGLPVEGYSADLSEKEMGLLKEEWDSSYLETPEGVPEE